MRRPVLFVCAAVVITAACARQERKEAPPVAPKLESFAAALESFAAALEPLSFCLPRAMHASMALSAAAPEDAAAREERRKQEFTDYFESFLDAREQGKYVVCLEKNKGSKRYAGSFEEKYAEAKSWLKRSEDEAARLEALYPKEKRIAGVAENFSDLDEKIGLRQVTITLKDGTKSSVESRFDKRMGGKP